MGTFGFCPPWRRPQNTQLGCNPCLGGPRALPKTESTMSACTTQAGRSSSESLSMTMFPSCKLQREGVCPLQLSQAFRETERFGLLLLKRLARSSAGRMSTWSGVQTHTVCSTFVAVADLSLGLACADRSRGTAGGSDLGRPGRASSSARSTGSAPRVSRWMARCTTRASSGTCCEGTWRCAFRSLAMLIPHAEKLWGCSRIAPTLCSGRGRCLLRAARSCGWCTSGTPSASMSGRVVGAMATRRGMRTQQRRRLWSFRRRWTALSGCRSMTF
mmetsp:Transcript_50918/g.146274  ORF Transcript_50918/g.146274 Transcript_50918/m.146274 type:complete len:273 (-) Transcript_50918:168-986(-)